MLCFGLFLGEHILAYSAKRALEILGKILKLRSGLDSVIGIAYSLVVFPSAYVTYIFHFNYLTFLTWTLILK